MKERLCKAAVVYLVVITVIALLVMLVWVSPKLALAVLAVALFGAVYLAVWAVERVDEE